MTHAEMLRKDAELAMREGGMYYSGEYLSGIATAAENLEAENKKLRRLVKQMYPLAVDYLYLMRQLGHIDDVSYEWAMQLQKLGIEVD